MHTPSFKEDHISQVPALQLLQNLGFEYLSPAEALALRGGKTSGVLLEDILRQQLQALNRIHYKNEHYAYSESNISTGIQVLKNAPLQEGLISASEAVYKHLTNGYALEQTIEGDKKS
ncbi:MAG: restriction endonuclease subunit R, partial [Phaeodactylibacter sp.]|nr:restriction endonuclease subunit R [Phaeodactylibacter sp.]